MSSFVDEQIVFSNLIKEIGSTCIDDGKTISEILTINGVSLWEVASPEMAWRHLVNISEAKKFSERLKVFLRPQFYKVKLISKLISNSFVRINFKTKPNSDYIMSLGFSPQMYNDVVQPIVKKLVNEEKFEHALVCLAYDKERYSPQNISIIPFGKHKIQNFNKKRKHYFQYLKKAENIIKKSKTYKDLTLRYNKKFDLDIINRLFQLFFEGLAPINLVNIIYAQFYLDHISPKCIISPDIADSRCRTFVLIAKNRGIPVYEIQFGLTGPEGIEWRFFESNRVAVWGLQAKNHLISHGVPSSKISVTGSARHDMLVNQTRKDFYTSKQNHKSNSVKILFASTYIDKAHGKYCCPEKIVEMKKAVIKSAIANQDIFLTIKPHPKENEADLKKIVDICGNNISIAKKDEDIRNLIMECDAFISFGSTASLDALLAGKKTGSLAFPGWNFSDELLEKTPIIVLDNLEKVSSFMKAIIAGRKIVYSPKELNQIEQLCLFDGKATERVSEDVLDLIKLKINR